MTIKDLFNTTKENYERAIRTGNECSIANVINAYNAFCALYRVQLISPKLFINILKIFTIWQTKYIQRIYTMI